MVESRLGRVGHDLEILRGGEGPAIELTVKLEELYLPKTRKSSEAEAAVEKQRGLVGYLLIGWSSLGAES